MMALVLTCLHTQQLAQLVQFSRRISVEALRFALHAGEA